MALLNETRMFTRMDVMRGPVVDTAHDFTTMTYAQVLTAYPLASFGSDRYVPQADGSYVLRAAGQAPVTDKGVVVDGAFVNYASNGVLVGAVAGTPGTLPIYWQIADNTTLTEVSVETHVGLPALCATERTVYDNTVVNLPRNNFSVPQSTYISGSMHAWYDTSLNATQELIVFYSKSSYNSLQTAAINGWNKYAFPGLARDPADLTAFLSPVPKFATAGSECTLGAAGVQIVTLPFCPNTLALSSAATTAKVADIIQRAVDLRGPFAVEIVATTAPGDPGAHQTYWCPSLGANDYAHIYRATVTDEITIKVRANGVDYSVACGPVADNTQFTLRLGMRFNKVDWSLNESTAASLTIKRSAAYIMETLGALWNATLPAWGSVQSIRIAAGKIATAAEIEGGWS